MWPINLSGDDCVSTREVGRAIVSQTGDGPNTKY
jgi:hypothetical protein